MLPKIQFGGIFRLTATPIRSHDQKILQQLNVPNDTVVTYGYGILNNLGMLQGTRNFMFQDQLMLVKNDPDQPDLDDLESQLQKPGARKKQATQDFFNKAEQEKRIEKLEFCYTILRQPEQPAFRPDDIRANRRKPFSECALQPNPNRPGKYLGEDEKGMENRLVIRRLKGTNPKSGCNIDIMI